MDINPQWITLVSALSAMTAAALRQTLAEPSGLMIAWDPELARHVENLPRPAARYPDEVRDFWVCRWCRTGNLAEYVLRHLTLDATRATSQVNSTSVA